MEEEREGKKLLGSQGKSKTDYFKDKFIISLKIQYGCRLENVTDCGREVVNESQFLTISCDKINGDVFYPKFQMYM